jgi:hypothetical protein
MSFARWTFRISAIYGLIVTVPLFFLENKVSRDYPPPINHPEYFYGFAGLVVAWQIAFWLISTDPLRYRPLMLVGVLEKLGWVIATPILVALERTHPSILPFAALDGVMMVLFFVAWVKTRERASEDTDS